RSSFSGWTRNRRWTGPKPNRRGPALRASPLVSAHVQIVFRMAKRVCDLPQAKRAVKDGRLDPSLLLAHRDVAPGAAAQDVELERVFARIDDPVFGNICLPIGLAKDA